MSEQDPVCMCGVNDSEHWRVEDHGFVDADLERWAEWRETIGVRLMTAMRCGHAEEDFGDGAVCDICFENVQRVGAILESEIRATS